MAEHGTRHMYNYRHCRCELCKEALRNYMRSLKGRPVPTHGESGYLNYKCRCDVCKAAGSAHNRRMRENRKFRASV